MKRLLQLLFCVALLFSIAGTSYCVPLSGTYIIGPTGNYATIGGAVAAVTTEGVSGPVTFKIMSGVYNESNTLPAIPFASFSKPVTFESMAADADSVIITGPGIYTFTIQGASYITLRMLTLHYVLVTDTCSNIAISDNKFSHLSDSYHIEMELGSCNTLSIDNNTGLAGISNPLSFGISNLEISGNQFVPLHSYIQLYSTNGAIVDKNSNMANVIFENSNSFSFSGNKVEAQAPGFYAVKLTGCYGAFMKNNFINCDPGAFQTYIENCLALQCINNTFQSFGHDTTITCRNNNGITLENNIYDNDSGGYSVSYNGDTALTSDYNSYNNGGAFDLIRYNGTTYTLANFQTATGEDMHSVMHNTQFAPIVGDLHLHPSEGGNTDLAGIPYTLVTDDIDGEPRNPLHPYKGADELPDFPLPVELASFTSSVSGNNAELLWATVSENNNYGFEIERHANDGSSMKSWSRIGFIKGNGTTSLSKNYSYNDNNLNSGRYSYRLKQIDFNGAFRYHSLSNEVIIGVPSIYNLSQNYPNPFNPSTKIGYEIPHSGNVSVKIYDITGKLMRTLVNEFQNAGFYTVNFYAADLSSGEYFYEIRSSDFRDVKKMLLIK